MVLIREDLGLQVRPVFLDPEGRLVVLDVIVVAVHEPSGGGQVDFF